MITTAGQTIEVAPIAGARIEIFFVPGTKELLIDVAPIAGARIEIALSVRLRLSQIVAPIAGARIEISTDGDLYINGLGRSHRGSAD